MTVIVTGNPRGGTTSVARVVSALGIVMLHDLPNTLDWMEMRDHLLNGRWGSRRQIVASTAIAPMGI